MAVTQENTVFAVKVVYKPSFDDSGELTLGALSHTFSKVKETATPEQLKTYADALLSLTKYYNAPYKVEFINTSQLVTA